MSDLIELRQGAHPWRPTPDAEMVHVLDEYNIPLAGIIRQSGHQYLFVCHHGEDEEVNVWLFSLLEDREVERLTHAVGRSLIPAMQECLKSRRVVAAFAAQAELVLWDWFDAGAEDEPIATVRRFLRRAQRRLAVAREGIDHLERETSQEGAQAELAFA